MRLGENISSPLIFVVAIVRFSGKTERAKAHGFDMGVELIHKGQSKGEG